MLSLTSTTTQPRAFTLVECFRTVHSHSLDLESDSSAVGFPSTALMAAGASQKCEPKHARTEHRHCAHYCVISWRRTRIAESIPDHHLLQLPADKSSTCEALQCIQEAAGSLIEQALSLRVAAVQDFGFSVSERFGLGKIKCHQHVADGGHAMAT